MSIILRKYFGFVGLLTALIIMSSCSTSNDVVNNGLIQKRKYRSGYHTINTKRIAKQENKRKADLKNIDIASSEELEEKSIENEITPAPSSDKDQRVLDTRFPDQELEANKVKSTKERKSELRNAKTDYLKKAKVIGPLVKKSIKKDKKLERIKEADDEKSDEDILGLISLIVAATALFFMLIGLLIGLLYALALPMLIASLVMGIISRDTKYGKLGMVLSIIGLILWVLLLVVVFIIIILLLGLI